MRNSQSAQTGLSILIVDDQEDYLISVRRLLERQGHHVVTTTDGQHALSILKEQPIQVALVDYAMPQMSGEELIREIRKRDPLLQIILHTGYCSRHTAHTLLKELSIQGFHDKSDDPDRLLLWLQAARKRQDAIAELQGREQAHKDLIAHVSHEIRNPLHVIGGYCDVLLNGAAGNLPERARPVVQVIAGRAHGLSDLTSNILVHSKLQAAKLDVLNREVRLAKLLTYVQERMQLLLAGKNVGFSLDTDNPSLTMTTDDTKVEIILHNLLSNAVRFTHQGSIHLRVAAIGLEIQFAVRDTGIGIAQEHLEEIFEPFWQAHKSKGNDVAGVGLGLSVARRLASLLGGTLQVSSELGVGSDFILTLPIEPELRLTPAIAIRPVTRATAAPTEIKKSSSRFGFFRPF